MFERMNAEEVFDALRRCKGDAPFESVKFGEIREGVRAYWKILEDAGVPPAERRRFLEDAFFREGALGRMELHASLDEGSRAFTDLNKAHVLDVYNAWKRMN